MMRYVLATGLLPLLYTPPLLADPFQLRGGVGVAHAVGGYQQDELSFGATAGLGAEYRVAPEVALGLKAVGLWLSPGTETGDVRIKATEGASLYGAACGLSLYPLADDDGPINLAAGGLWIGVSGGVASTGGFWRPTLDANLGWDLYWPQASFGFGPVLSLLHVFQFDDEVRPEDANVLSLGVSGRFGAEPSRSNIDRDGDRVFDSDDACRKQAEDLDGFEDQDGCPDTDNDGDGIFDDVDECPDQAEDRTDTIDADGCPDASIGGVANDRDHDGIEDVRDKCPSVSEDLDKFEDNDGCPELDNDKDGMPDTEDLCSNEPESVNNYADNDGCPDEDQVRVVGGEIVLDEVVQFATNISEISNKSHDLLRRLAKLLREHPEYEHISIEGHADLRGTEAQNVALSADRARAVLNFLVKEGVAAGRLSSKGYGSSRPLVPGHDEQALQKNRRVEFVVTRAGSVPPGRGVGGGMQPIQESQP